MTIDFRARDDVDVDTIDVADFFGAQLPGLAAERSALAVPGARELGVRPFTIETTAGTWTLSVDDDSVRGGPPAALGTPRCGSTADGITDIVHDRPDADDAPRGRNARHAQRGTSTTSSTGGSFSAPCSMPAPYTPRVTSHLPTVTAARSTSSARSGSTTIRPNWRTTWARRVTST